MRWIIVVFALVVTGSLLACGDSEREADSGGGLSPAERKEREAKALEMFGEALKAQVPEKVRLFRKVVAFYPDTSVAPKAHHHLVFYLLDPVLNRREEALAAAEDFAQRHPGDREVINAFSLLVGVEERDKSTPDTPALARALKSWRAFMGKRRAALAASGSVDEKAHVWLWSARCEIHAQEHDRARALLLEASRWEPERRQLKKDILVDLGVLHSMRAGGRADARRTFLLAMDLMRQANAKPRGPTEERLMGSTIEDIQDLIDRLDK